MVHCHTLSPNSPITEKQHVMGNSQPATPSLFHPLVLAFLLSYLGAYFLPGRFNSLLGQCCLLRELFHMGMVSIPVGSLVTGLNPSAAIHLLGDMFPSRWVSDKKSHLWWSCVFFPWISPLDTPSLPPSTSPLWGPGCHSPRRRFEHPRAWSQARHLVAWWMILMGLDSYFPLTICCVLLVDATLSGHTSIALDGVLEDSSPGMGAKLS